MAAVTKNGTPSPSTPVVSFENRLPSGDYAAEAIGAGDPCYIASDGIHKSLGAAANAAAVVDGYAPQAYAIGDPCTLYWDCNFAYGTGMAPGTFLYLGTAGGFDTAPTTGGTVPIARVLSDGKRIYVQKSY